MTDQQQSLFFGARDASTYAPGVGTIAPVAGTYTITGWGETTPSINWNDNNTTIQGYVDLLNGIQVLSLNGATGGTFTLSATGNLSYSSGLITLPCSASDIDIAWYSSLGETLTSTTDLGNGNFAVDLSVFFANWAVTPTAMTVTNNSVTGSTNEVQTVSIVGCTIGTFNLYPSSGAYIDIPTLLSTGVTYLQGQLDNAMSSGTTSAVDNMDGTYSISFIANGYQAIPVEQTYSLLQIFNLSGCDGIPTLTVSTIGQTGIPTIAPYPNITTTAITNGFTFDMGGEFAESNQSVMTVNSSLLQDASSVTVTVTQSGVADTPITPTLTLATTANSVPNAGSPGYQTINLNGATSGTFSIYAGYGPPVMDVTDITTAIANWTTWSGGTMTLSDNGNGTWNLAYAVAVGNAYYYANYFIGVYDDTTNGSGVTLINGVAPVDPIAGVFQVDTLTFSSVPTGGTLTLINGYSTVSVNINYYDTSSTVQSDAIYLIGIGYFTTVSGDFSTGFTFTWSDYLEHDSANSSNQYFELGTNALVIAGLPQIMTIVENDSPTAGNVGFFVNGTQETEWVYNDSGSGVASGVSTATGQTYTCSGTAGNWTVTSSVDYYDSNTYTAGSDTTTPAPLTKACPAELDITTFLNFCSGGVAVGGTATLGSPGLDCVGGCKVGGHTSISLFVNCSGGAKTGGHSSPHKHLINNCSGGAKTGGHATHHKHLINNCSGGVATGGTALPVSDNLIINCHGGCKTGGTALPDSDSLFVNCSGGVKTGGLTTHHKHLIIACSGGVKTGGLTTNHKHLIVSCSGGVKTGGLTTHHKHLILSCSGGAKTGGTALTSGSIDCHGGCRIGSMPFTKKRTINLSSGVVLNNFVLQLYIPNSGNNAVFFNPINGKRYLSKNIADEFYHVKVDLQNENILVNY